MLLTIFAEGTAAVDPIVSGLIEALTSGKIFGWGAIVALAVVLTRLATKIEHHGKDLVDAVEGIRTDLKEGHVENRKDHKTTREQVDIVHKRVEALEKTVVTAIVGDGSETRQVIGDKRLDELRDALEEHAVSYDVTPASGMVAPKRKPSQPGAEQPRR